jgi:hypothetical protein
MPKLFQTEEQNMKQKIASKRKSLFTKKTFELAGVVVFIITALFLAGCSTGVGYDIDKATSGRAALSVMDDPSIYGTWEYTYDYYDDQDVHHFGYEEYVITGSGTSGTISYTFHDNLYGDYGNFDAEIADIVYNNGDTSGVILIHYTSPPTEDDEDKYNAVYFQALTGDNEPGDTVQLANAVELPIYDSSAVDTLLEAEEKFTWEYADLYIDWDYVNPQIRQ